VECFVDVGADGADMDAVVFDVDDEALEECGEEVAASLPSASDRRVRCLYDGASENSERWQIP
jgi:hypothetical protein